MARAWRRARDSSILEVDGGDALIAKGGDIELRPAEFWKGNW